MLQYSHSSRIALDEPILDQECNVLTPTNDTRSRDDTRKQHHG